jgi:hypothetical protein
LIPDLKNKYFIVLMKLIKNCNMKKQDSFNTNQLIRFMYKELQHDRIKSQEWWNFIAKQDKAVVIEETKKIQEAEDRLKKYTRSAHFLHKIRKYCNYHGYSDAEPYEVVEVVNFKCVVVRKMKAELSQAPVHHIGGFLAHTENDTQKWDITSDPDGTTLKIFLGKHGWSRGQFRMNDNPIKFYDYNF